MLDRILEKECDFEFEESSEIPTNFVNGNFHVQRTTFQQAIVRNLKTNEVKYQGNFNFEKCCIEGWGKYFYESGSVFEGQFFENLRQEGKLEFITERPTGRKARTTCKNLKNRRESVYTGTFKKNLPSGPGKLRINEFDLEYEGTFTNGLFDGVGQIDYHKDNKIYTYKGEFSFGQYNGRGEGKMA